MMNKREKINVALCWTDSDGNYSKFPATTILSILENNKNNLLYFHLICPGIKRQDQKKIEKMINNYKQKVLFYTSLNENSTKLLKLINKKNRSSFGLGAYMRLVIPYELSTKINKIIYLDSDIIVVGDLKDLFSIDLGTFSIGAVNHDFHEKIVRWNLSQYINSGVLLLDLDKIRKINLESRIKKILKEYSSDFYFNGKNSCADQDLINIIFEGRIKLLDKIYNLDVGKSKFFKEGVVFHYSWLFKPFRFKPCFIDKKYKELYFYYFDKTSWKGWRPGWDFKKGFMTTNFYFFMVRILKEAGLEKPLKKVINLRLKKRI